jgi:hypothetical protein
MKWTARRFPGLERQIRGLVQQHRELRDEPLHLAMGYRPRRAPRDIFLFELASNFGGNATNHDRELFEVTFLSSTGFPMPSGQKLHLVLTSPKEFRAALDECWPTAEEVQDAVRRGEFEVLYKDKTGEEALERKTEAPTEMKKAKTTSEMAAKLRGEFPDEPTPSVAAPGSKRQRKSRSRP